MTNLFYHGTSPLAAICIAMDGFRLLDNNLRRWSGGALGDGIYITADLSTASFFAEIGARSPRKTATLYVIRTRLSAGTRILRLDGSYDRKVIDYLGREFGRELFTPKFDRAIPSNKHLTAVELINLANYLWERGAKHGGIAAWSGHEDQGPLRRYLAKHKFDGMGCTESDIGVVVFNPSKLVHDGTFLLAGAAGPEDSVSIEREYLPELVKPDWRRLANSAAKDLLDTIKEIPRIRESLAANEAARKPDMAKWDREQLAAYLAEVPRRQACLRKYCEQHGVSTIDSRIAPALQQI